jgi:hypothetical protein
VEGESELPAVKEKTVVSVEALLDAILTDARNKAGE